MAATLVGFTGAVLRAQTPELLPLLPQWDSVFTLRAAAGYKDNPLLTAAEPHGSAFVSGGGEVMLLRISPAATQFSFFASADATRFLSGPDAHNEYIAFSQAQWEHDFNEAWKGTLGAQYFFQDQVLDVSTTETNQQATPVRGHTLALRPGVRWNLSRQFWIALEAGGARQFFDEPLDDYWEAGPKLTLGRSYIRNSQITLSYEPLWRPYDDDPARTATGDAITNSHRLWFQHDTRLIWRHNWDEPKHWRTVAGVGVRITDENGEDFANYTRWAASAKVEYRGKPWEIALEGRLAYYDYSTQTVSLTDLSPRRRTEWIVGLRLERELSRHLKLALSYEHEEILSNDPLETYTVNTVSGTVSWEF